MDAVGDGVDEALDRLLKRAPFQLKLGLPQLLLKLSYPRLQRRHLLLHLKVLRLVMIERINFLHRLIRGVAPRPPGLLKNDPGPHVAVGPCEV